LSHKAVGDFRRLFLSDRTGNGKRLEAFNQEDLQFEFCFRDNCFMWTRHRRRSPFRHVILPIFAIGVLAYFGHHALTGSLGLASKQEYESRTSALKAELASLESQREELEKRTAMLRDGSLERDMIDEQARRLLGNTRENEIVILN
jgi:cell division protein FtsB